MLPGGDDPLYRSLLRGAHQHYARVEVWGGGRRLAALNEADFSGDQGGLVFLPGSSISASLDNQVARNLDLIVPLDMYDDPLFDVTSGNEVRVWRGIALADGLLTYVWPTFRGKIADVGENTESGTCTVQAADRAQEVLDAGFFTPKSSNAGANLISEYRRLVLEAVPDAEFGASDAFDDLEVPDLAWELDRGSAIEELFSSGGALWYPLADGAFVARRYPWTVPSSPVVTLSDAAGGEILAARRSKSRSSLYNQVTVTGERLNGDTPVFATEQDINPLSPTFVDGPFGVRSLLLRRQTPSTPGAAKAAAKAALRSSISPIETWSWTQSADAAQELGDVVALDARGQTGVIQVVKSFTLPVGMGPMQVDGVSMVISAVQGGGML